MFHNKKYTFNWTKLECKRISLFAFSSISASFNWTKLECKHTRIYIQEIQSRAFNWTKLECKPVIEDGYEFEAEFF